MRKRLELNEKKRCPDAIGIVVRFSMEAPNASVSSRDDSWPVWAKGVMRSAVAGAPLQPKGVCRCRDAESGLEFWSGPGFYVVAVDETTRERLVAALRLVAGLRQDDPIAVAAFAFTGSTRLSHRLLTQLADRDVVVPRNVGGATASENVEEIVSLLLKMRQAALDNLDRYAAWTAVRRSRRDEGDLDT